MKAAHTRRGTVVTARTHSKANQNYLLKQALKILTNSKTLHKHGILLRAVGHTHNCDAGLQSSVVKSTKKKGSQIPFPELLLPNSSGYL